MVALRFCFHIAVLAGLALVPIAATSAPALRLKSVVRADPKTGRLVRAFVVIPRAIASVPAAVAKRPGAAFDNVEFVNIPEIVESTAKKYEMDPLLVHSLIQVESGYNQTAVSNKGAQGLMQLMPGTARRFGVRNSFDVRENIEGGIRYLRYLTSLFPDDLRLALAAYNAGEGAVWKYNNKIPPYRETLDYVEKVGGRYMKAIELAKSRKGLAPAEKSPEAGRQEPAEPLYARIESFLDSSGRLHLRTLTETPPEGMP